jgi:hypothetical protein
MKRTSFFKHIGVALILTFSFFQADAQSLKGNLLTEMSFGDISFGNSKYDYLQNDTLSSQSEGDYFSADLFPRLGYFINDKLAVGTEFEIYFYSGTYSGINKDGIKYYESKSANTSLGFLPFARYYFYGSSNGKSMFYGQLSGGVYMHLSDKNDSKYLDAAGNVTSTYATDYIHHYKSLSGNMLVGWNRFITQNIALNINMGYSITKSTSANKSISTSGGTSTSSDEYKNNYYSGNFSWNFGFSMFIPCKKTQN